MERLSIVSSVGEHAKNDCSDVLVIQKLLNISIRFNLLVPFNTLKEDGKIGKFTKHIIKEFQRRVVGIPIPDGLIQPEGKTIQKLQEIAAQENYNPLSALFKIKLLLIDICRQPSYPAGPNIALRNLSKNDFVAALLVAAKIEEKSSGVPAAITTAQGILETDYGKSVPIDIVSGRYSFNLFGIKGDGSVGHVSVFTHEFQGGKMVKIEDKFKAYRNYQESIKSRTDFLKANKRYRSLFNLTDAKKWAQGLQDSGYATDPNYAQKLISVMTSWNL